MQQRCGDRNGIEVLPHEDLRHLNRMGDEIIARQALLTTVSRRAELEGALHQVEVEPILVLGQGLSEFSVHRLERAGHSSPASAKLKYRSPATIT